MSGQEIVRPLLDLSLGKDRAAWWSHQYLIDWLIGVIVIIVTAICDSAITPFHRDIPNPYYELIYPTDSDIVPVWLLVLLCEILPIVFYIGIQYWIRSHHDLHHALLGHFSVIVITTALTVWGKKFAGRTRPNFNPSDAYIADKHQSFPSGHSSTAFCTMVFLSLYLAGKLRLFSKHRGSGMARFVLITPPIILASFIAMSRTRDYHHHFSDILAGACLGCFVAFFIYFIYYPSLFEKTCKSPRNAVAESSEDKLNGEDMDVIPSKELIPENQV